MNSAAFPIGKNEYPMTRFKLNDATMWCLAAFIAIVPLFLGGNRPLVWIGAFAVMCLLLATYLALIFYINQDLAFSLKRVSLYGVVYLVFIGFQFIQILSALMFHSGDIDGPNASCCALSLAPRETVLALLRWLTFGMVAFLSLQVCANKKRASRFMTLLFWIAVVHAVLGFVLFFMLNDAALLGQKWSYEGSMTGAFINRNTFATMLAAGLVLGAAQLLKTLPSRARAAETRTSARPVALAIVAAALMVLVVDIASTNSRMGLIVALAGVTVFLALIGLQPSKPGTTAAASDDEPPVNLPRRVMFLLLGALLVVFLLLSPQLLDRVLLAEHSIADRTALYAQTWNMIMTRPLTGFGGGSFAIAFPLFHQPPVNTDYIWDKAHNSYLALWSEYGLVFGSLPILLVGMAFAALVANARRDAVIAVAAAVIVLSGLHALVDFSLEIEGYTVFFIAVVACGLARALSSGQRSEGASR